MEEAEIEVSLEEIVYLLKCPPLIEKISFEKNVQKNRDYIPIETSNITQ